MAEGEKGMGIERTNENKQVLYYMRKIFASFILINLGDLGNRWLDDRGMEKLMSQCFQMKFLLEWSSDYLLTTFMNRLR